MMRKMSRKLLIQGMLGYVTGVSIVLLCITATLDGDTLLGLVYLSMGIIMMFIGAFAVGSAIMGNAIEYLLDI